jgi:hypothetical protein
VVAAQEELGAGAADEPRMTTGGAQAAARRAAEVGTVLPRQGLRGRSVVPMGRGPCAHHGVVVGFVQGTGGRWGAVGRAVVGGLPSSPSARARSRSPSNVRGPSRSATPSSASVSVRYTCDA